MEALHALTQERFMLHKIAEQLKSTPLSASQRLETLLIELREMQRAQNQVQDQQLGLMIPELLKSMKVQSQYSVIASEVANVSNLDALRDLCIKARDQLGDIASVVALIAVVDGKPAVIVTASKKAQVSGAKAGDLVLLASQVLGGRGGGSLPIGKRGYTLRTDIDG
jgi:alanyl-tRNA synthetase